MEADGCVLSVNAGSSSVKYAVFDTSDPQQKLHSGSVEPKHAAEQIMQELQDAGFATRITAVGHRVVGGGLQYSKHERIDAKMLEALHERAASDPEHLPAELALIEAFQEHFSSVPHVACFDTVFFNTLPDVAQMLPIPRRFFEKGIRRYGFHGLSHTYLMNELTQTLGEEAAQGRIVLAHLGSGASLAAVVGGQPVDTTMAFTPQSGIPMSTRSGDLDPGIAGYLAQHENIDAKAFNEMVSKESGLLGISGTTGAMYELLQKETDDANAAQAIALFCYAVKKQIGAYAAALGGLDTLVFAGGIGEKAPKIRARICEGLAFLGVELDATKNDANEKIISVDNSSVIVLAIYTDEEAVIAQETLQIVTG